MKHFTKRLAILFTVIATLLASLAVFAACGGSGGTYTVTVLDPDGNPFPNALVQPCVVESNGTLGTCFPSFVPTDANGVAVLEIGKEIPSKKVNHLEMHVHVGTPAQHEELPMHLTYDPLRLHKNEAGTINIAAKTPIAPKSGTGAGSYMADGNQIELDDFDPYVVNDGEDIYTFKFTSADQKLFFAFVTDWPGNYRVYSVGAVDAAVTQLFGNPISGIRNMGGAENTNDNVSATDKNFSLDFVVEPSLLEQTQATGTSYFELSLSNPADVNKEGIVCFQFISDYEEDKTPDVVDVKPAKPLTPYDEQNGTYIDVPLNGFEPKKLADGYYHMSDEADSAVVVATLGKADGKITPNRLDASFIDIGTKNQALIFNSKNYLPLVEAYTNATNSEGRYPLTDELIGFFTAYIDGMHILDDLPEGNEWLVWCGYYGEAGNTGADGTLDKPYTLTENDIKVNLSAGGKVYYTFTTPVPAKLTLTSASDNVSLSYYEVSEGSGSAQTEESDGAFSCVLDLAAGEYIFAFSTADAAAGSYTVTVSIDPVGSEDNPKVITAQDFGKPLADHIVLEFGFIFYTYTATGDETLYFDWTGNTWLTVSVDDVYLSSEDSSDDAKWAAGVTLHAGDILGINVGLALDGQPGATCFAISTAPFGTEANPHIVYSDGDGQPLDVNIPQGGDGNAYYRIIAGAKGVKITITSSDNENVKLTSYFVGEDKSSAQVTLAEGNEVDGWWFQFEVIVNAGQSCNLIFSMKNGGEGSYSVHVRQSDAPKPGSMDNPIKITEFKKYTGEVELVEGRIGPSIEPVYYSYTVSDVTELYFKEGANTEITLEWWVGYTFNQMTVAELEAWYEGGNQFTAGTVLTIIVSTADRQVGTVEFEIASSPIGG